MIPENFEFTKEEFYALDDEDRLLVLKASVSCPDVAMFLGAECDGPDEKIPSPWNPDERTPSCHIYEDHFYDYSTGRGGDIFDLAQALQPEYCPDLGSAVKLIAKKAMGVGVEFGSIEVEKPRVLQDFSADLEQYELDPFNAPYGLRFDHNGNMLVPHRDPEGVYGVKVRFLDGGKGSWAGSTFTHRLYDPYGWELGHEPRPMAVVCEGESDCWALISVLDLTHQAADVYALPSGAGAWKDHWRKDLACYNTVHVCTDNDRAGKDAREKLMRKIGFGVTKELRVPQLYNDAREAIDAGWRPQLEPLL